MPKLPINSGEKRRRCGFCSHNSNYSSAAALRSPRSAGLPDGNLLLWTATLPFLPRPQNS